MIVTAGANVVPDPLISQLKAVGRMVIPLGVAPHSQMLVVLTRLDENSVNIKEIIPVRFVPFVRSDK